MYCLHKSGKVCKQFQEKTAIHFILLGLVQPASGHSSMRMYTIWWKASCTLTVPWEQRTIGTAFI